MSYSPIVNEAKQPMPGCVDLPRIWIGPLVEMHECKGYSGLHFDFCCRQSSFCALWETLGYSWNSSPLAGIMLKRYRYGLSKAQLESLHFDSHTWKKLCLFFQTFHLIVPRILDWIRKKKWEEKGHQMFKPSSFKAGGSASQKNCTSVFKGLGI